MNSEKLKCANINIMDLQADVLPKGYQNGIHICLFDEHKNFTFRMKFTNEEEFNTFLEVWSNETHITWRVNKTDPNNMCAGNKNIFWRQYRCQSGNTRIDKSTKNASKKHTDCKAQFTVTIKKVNKRCRSQDKHLPEYPTIIKGCIAHNHGIFCADNLKYKDVSKDVLLKFSTLFENGDSPTSALEKHKFDLQAKYKENYFIAAADRSLCPDLQWCYKLYNSIKRKEYDVQENFEEQLSSRFDKACFKLSKIGDHTIIAICTPLMKRVHYLWPYSGELVFLDSSGNFDCQQHRVFVVLTHSYAGGLPLGIIITTSESETVISEGLKCLTGLIGDKGFYGKGCLGPNVIITDDSQAEQNAIKNTFPQVVSLLCTFHILQAAWRYIWNAENGVKMIDRPQLINYIKQIMYAESEEDMEKIYKSAIISSVFSANPKILKYLNDLWDRRQLWGLGYRKHLKIRGNNTNNYVESAMRIIKDKIFHRKKAYNIVHLMEFIFQNLEEYYVRKLTDMAINKNDCCVQRKHLHYDNKQELVIASTENDDIFHVKNSKKDTYYIVDAKLGLCSCYMGFNGAPCKHQSAVIQTFKIESFNFVPVDDYRQRNLIHKIANGEDSEIPPNFYNSLKDITNSNFDKIKYVDPLIPSGSASAMPESQVIPHENQQKDHVVHEFKTFTEYIEEKLKTEPDFISAVNAFNNSFKRCKTDTALLHALHTFGKTVGKKGNKQMNVQPTSRARRKRPLGGCNRVGSGRPSKRSRVEHSYFKKDKRIKKAPHSVSECISRNVSLGR